MEECDEEAALEKTGRRECALRERDRDEAKHQAGEGSFPRSRHYAASAAGGVHQRRVGGGGWGRLKVSLPERGKEAEDESPQNNVRPLGASSGLDDAAHRRVPGLIGRLVPECKVTRAPSQDSQAAQDERSEAPQLLGPVRIPSRSEGPQVQGETHWRPISTLGNKPRNVTRCYSRCYSGWHAGCWHGHATLT